MASCSMTALHGSKTREREGATRVNAEAAEPYTVLIADDHQLFRDGLRALLASAPELACVGEAATGNEAVALAASLQPDVVLMDLQLPGGMNGVEATQRILAQSPHIGVLMVTMFDDDNSIFAAMRAGARGYVLKGANHQEMLRAIRAVVSGEAIFSPAIARRLMEFFDANQRRAPSHLFPELSDREREILELLAQGAKNAEIAARLVLSPKTVRNYVSNVISKLQVADRAEAILRARAAGLG
jgi:DNA-binding NarL/FixJ family response regulator